MNNNLWREKLINNVAKKAVNIGNYSLFIFFRNIKKNILTNIVIMCKINNVGAENTA